MIGILLAAGRGTRLKSTKSKMLLPICGREMLRSPFETLAGVCSKIYVVLGHQHELVREAVEKSAKLMEETSVEYVIQEEQNGTGGAIKSLVAKVGLEKLSQKNWIVLNGDLPLFEESHLKNFISNCQSKKLSAACLSVNCQNPSGLGRILRDPLGRFAGIREEKDASAEERKIREINSGVYFFSPEIIETKLSSLTAENSQSEFYITDLLKKDEKYLCEAISHPQEEDVLGINTSWEWSQINSIAQRRLQKRLAEEKGVMFEHPDSIHVDAGVEFSGSCFVGRGTKILGQSKIGVNVHIEGQCYLNNAEIGENSQIRWSSVVENSILKDAVELGPFARVREKTELSSSSVVGNFVEVKKSQLGKKVKAKHLAYLGDAEIGDEANISCGVITCNYDGVKKSKTRIGEKAFIGSDVQLIAPVEIGDEAYVAAGTTLTRSISKDDLAIGRPELKVKEGYASKLKKRFLAAKEKLKKENQ